MVRQNIVVEEPDHLYEYTFDELLNNVAYNSAEEKHYLQCPKYPIIFAEIPKYLKKKYNSHISSKTEIQIMATRLGFSKIQHDERSKKITEIAETTLENYTDLRTVDRVRSKTPYYYATLESRNTKAYLPICEWVFNVVEDMSSDFGIWDYQLGIAAFFIGIYDSDELNTVLKSHVRLEVAAFWETVDKRLTKLEDGNF